eukprot:COSAG02_NODE_2128_length_9740_cov_20.436833_3_plen_64_part_00
MIMTAGLDHRSPIGSIHSNFSNVTWNYNPADLRYEKLHVWVPVWTQNEKYEFDQVQSDSGIHL